MSRRTERVASILQRELAMIIMHELDDPRLVGLPSITRIKVSEDLSIADVYVSIMGSEGKQSAALNALKHSAGMMRSRLSEDLEMRQVPYLKFHIDENLKKEREVLDILHQIELENAAKQAAAPEVAADAGGDADAQITEDSEQTDTTEGNKRQEDASQDAEPPAGPGQPGAGH